jgi:hypothetical protein
MLTSVVISFITEIREELKMKESLLIIMLELQIMLGKP